MVWSWTDDRLAAHLPRHLRSRRYELVVDVGMLGSDPCCTMAVAVVKMDKMWYSTRVIKQINCRGGVISTPRREQQYGGTVTMTHSTRTPSFPANLEDYAPWVAIHGLFAPYGQCQCGCGQDAPISKKVSMKDGRVKGGPYRYADGHSGRTNLLLRVPSLSDRLCECGCGQYTQNATKSDPERGLRRGDPLRFVNGHQNGALRTLEEAFWGHVTPGDPNECWEWKGATDQRGYGLFGSKGRSYRAHRLSYEIHHGPLAPGMLACHTCDNPRCCNPDHLFQGTIKDNNLDKVRKGRQSFGERIGCSKLKEADIPQIRSLYASGITKTEIARRYGVAMPTVAGVISGRYWSHVP